MSNSYTLVTEKKPHQDGKEKLRNTLPRNSAPGIAVHNSEGTLNSKLCPGGQRIWITNHLVPQLLRLPQGRQAPKSPTPESQWSCAHECTRLQQVKKQQLTGEVSERALPAGLSTEGATNTPISQFLPGWSLTADFTSYCLGLLLLFNSLWVLTASLPRA